MSTHEGQAVLVTGAGSGIGRATALAFAGAGARVAAADIDAEAAAATADDAGAGALPVQEPHRGVESDRLQRRAAIMYQQRIEKRQQRINRVERRPARAAGEREGRIVASYQIAEYPVVCSCGLTLDSAQSVRRFRQNAASRCIGQTRFALLQPRARFLRRVRNVVT